ncbi:MAG: inositol monophosphatase family protein [bacterium]
MEKHLKLAVNAAKRAGLYQLKKLHTSRQIHLKGKNNFVTEVDIHSEKLICGAITQKFPHHGILTEEKQCRQDLTKIDRRYLWIIDPLDGTTNYIHHIPFFCVSIGLIIDGKQQLGVVYNPALDECFTAMRGKGAYLNGRRIHVSRQAKIDQALLATGFAYNLKQVKDDNLDNFVRVRRRCSGIRRCGAAAIDLAYTACGMYDGFWELFLNPWDTAAGSLLVKEAGGRISDFKGRPFNLYGRETLATNGRIHTALKILLK